MPTSSRELATAEATASNAGATQAPATTQTNIAPTTATDYTNQPSSTTPTPAHQPTTQDSQKPVRFFSRSVADEGKLVDWTSDDEDGGTPAKAAAEATHATTPTKERADLSSQSS